MIYPIHIPNLIQTLFPNLLWKMPKTEQKTLYLTFDDGPIPTITPWVLEQLEQYEAKATFFCVGANIEKYPAIFQQVKAAGHSIGNHTQQHLNGWTTSTDSYLKNIATCQQLTQTNLFRPPYGRLRPKQAKILQQKYQLVMWDVLAGDFDSNITSQKCINNITQHAQDGSIIVLHDSKKAWKHLQKILPFILEYYTKRGFVFESIS